LSESVAGVTFLAFGNGSPDVFSTFAAFNTHSGSLAIGELIGAAGFITAVVAGSMAIVRPFKVARRSFVRDVSCFVIAASFSMVFLADGRLTAWECAVMVAFYLAYVIFVVVWQWVLGRRRRNKLKEATARSHFSISELPGRGGIEEEIDNQDDTIGSSTRINKPIQADDFAALEEAGWNVPDTLDDEEQSEAREQWMVEINRNMRVQRPALGPHRNTGNQIRPSLVGALEFRAVLSSLEKLRDQRAMPIGMRRYSDDPSFTLAQQQHHHTRGKSNPQVDPLLKKTDARLAVDPWRPYRDNDNEGDRPSRNRAVSANDAYLVDMAQASSYLRRSIPKLAPEASTAARLNLPANSQSLAVPCLPDIAPSPSAQRSTVDQQTTIRPSIHSCNVADHGLQRPIIVQDESFLQSSDPPPELNRQLSNHAMLLSPGTAASSPAAPFPPYYDDPSYVPSTSRSQSIMLPPPSVDPGSFFSFKDVLDKPRPLRWWPYRFLPSPSVLASTLFPTLYSWSDKGLGERLLGVVSAPTIFLLTITLPVVEYESNSGETVNAKSGSDIRAVTSSGGSAATLQLEVADESLLEQRNTTEVSNSDGYADPGSSMPSITSTSRESETIPSLETSAESAPERSQPMKNGWNRWLLSTQIFTAPLFVVLILWANLDEQHSINNLALYVLYALLGSLCIFAALLLTTTDETPPKYRSAFCFVGFVVSVAWISTIAGEVVGVLKALGVILGISDAILGLTIFAVGNR
jgi:sodium/potassium/calcium exchanger 6